MGQHAKRFEAGNAPKGGGLRAVADQLKTVADTVEEWYDPGDPHVTSAMQRFEMGLNQLTMAAPHPDAGAPAESKKPRVTGGRRSKATTAPTGDTPTGDGGESAEDAS